MLNCLSKVALLSKSLKNWKSISNSFPTASFVSSNDIITLVNNIESFILNGKELDNPISIQYFLGFLANPVVVHGGYISCFLYDFLLAFFLLNCWKLCWFFNDLFVPVPKSVHLIF